MRIYLRGYPYISSNPVHRTHLVSHGQSWRRKTYLKDENELRLRMDNIM